MFWSPMEQGGCCAPSALVCPFFKLSDQRKQWSKRWQLMIKFCLLKPSYSLWTATTSTTIIHCPTSPTSVDLCHLCTNNRIKKLYPQPIPIMDNRFRNWTNTCIKTNYKLENWRKKLMIVSNMKFSSISQASRNSRPND